MKEHHIAWLEANKHRSKQWLKDRLADGFDIHHIDGNHGNNDPWNLILVESADHGRLHGLPMNRISAMEILARKREELRASDIEAGIVRGVFTPKHIKGRRYWYFQDASRKQRYVGAETADLMKSIEEHRRLVSFGDDIAATQIVKSLVV